MSTKNIIQEPNKKIKFINKDKNLDNTPNGFDTFFSFSNKLGQNYNTHQENDLIYSIDSRLNPLYYDVSTKNDIASRSIKASPDYWDNTKRKNLDTSVYTDSPDKTSGKGFGVIDDYNMFFNYIGLSTRQDNVDMKPQNKDDDRIYLTNHNYNYDKHSVTEMLPCGSDTRYLNKKMTSNL